MNLLALDTSTDDLSIVLKRGGEWFARSISGQRRHSQVLASLVQELFDEAKLRPHELTQIVSGVGPGSFTGLRVGLAFLKGLAAGSSIPIHPVCSLEFLAYHLKEEHDRIAVIRDARAGKYFLALYARNKGNRLQGLEKPQMCTLSQLETLLPSKEGLAITGDAIKGNLEIIKRINSTASFYDSPLWQVKPKNIQDYLENQEELINIRPIDLKPMYLRLSEPEEKLAKEKDREL